MLQSGFVIAMAAEIDLADYERPTSITRRMKRWLVVSRLGSDGEHLTISDTGALSTAAAQAPIGLTPAKTLLGILLSQAEAGDCIFMLARQPPERLPLAGTFFPAEGYARVLGSADSLRLHVEGRHAHSLGRRDGRAIRNYIADPAPNSRFAMAWHINATRRPWVGEFIPHASH